MQNTVDDDPTGCFVLATARSEDMLKTLNDEGFRAVALDVTDQDSIERCKKEVDEITGGKLDILINNA